MYAACLRVFEKWRSEIIDSLCFYSSGSAWVISYWTKVLGLCRTFWCLDVLLGFLITWLVHLDRSESRFTVLCFKLIFVNLSTILNCCHAERADLFNSGRLFPRRFRRSLVRIIHRVFQLRGRYQRHWLFSILSFALVSRGSDFLAQLLGNVANIWLRLLYGFMFTRLKWRLITRLFIDILDRFYLWLWRFFRHCWSNSLFTHNKTPPLQATTLTWLFHCCWFRSSISLLTLHPSRASSFLRRWCPCSRLRWVCLFVRLARCRTCYLICLRLRWLWNWKRIRFSCSFAWFGWALLCCSFFKSTKGLVCLICFLCLLFQLTW